MRRALLALGFIGLVLWATGSRAQEPEKSDLAIEVVDRLELAAGETVSVSVTLRAQGRQSISRDGDLELSARPRPVGAVGVAKSDFDREDAADPRADAPRFDLSVEGVAVGAAAVELRARAWVCGEHTCVPARARHRVRIEVAAPTPDAGPPDA